MDNKELEAVENVTDMVEEVENTVGDTTALAETSNNGVNTDVVKGVAIGAVATVGVYELTKRVVIPVGKKVVAKVKGWVANKKAAKAAKAEAKTETSETEAKA